MRWVTGRWNTATAMVCLVVCPSFPERRRRTVYLPIAEHSLSIHERTVSRGWFILAEVWTVLVVHVHCVVYYVQNSFLAHRSSLGWLEAGSPRARKGAEWAGAHQIAFAPKLSHQSRWRPALPKWFSRPRMCLPRGDEGPKNRRHYEPTPGGGAPACETPRDGVTPNM